MLTTRTLRHTQIADEVDERGFRSVWKLTETYDTGEMRTQTLIEGYAIFSYTDEKRTSATPSIITHIDAVTLEDETRAMEAWESSTHINIDHLAKIFLARI